MCSSTLPASDCTFFIAALPVFDMTLYSARPEKRKSRTHLHGTKASTLAVVPERAVLTRGTGQRRRKVMNRGCSGFAGQQSKGQHQLPFTVASRWFGSGDAVGCAHS